jgi:hypothetical protein
MRKRSKYKPKGVILNPIGYVLEGMTPLAQHSSVMLNLQILNHAAMTTLTTGKATRREINTLIAAVNMTEACYRLGFGKDYSELVVKGLEALRTVGSRGAATDKFILRAEEMRALNELMELHDAQLEVMTVRDMERAIQLVNEELRQKKATRITQLPEDTNVR